MERKQEAAASEAAVSAINKKRDEKARKKDARSWGNLMKVVGGWEETAKLAGIEKKYKELYTELKIKKMTYQVLESQYATLKKEIDHHQAELTKNVVCRARLEDLCRELQKQNKQIKEENIAKIKEEEERRKKVSSKFANKLSDINTMMDENKEKSEKLRDENMKMTAKLAEFYTRFQKREEDVARMAKEMELQRQYSQATLTKMDLEIKAEKEIYVQQHAIMQAKLEKSEANCRVLLDTVKSLQDHIDVYKSQYEDFENTMSKSNKVFDSFKSEMGAMSKQMSVLEKEAQNWKSKYHDSITSIIELSKMKASQDSVISVNEKKVDQLQKLCRQLQIDRIAFLKLLKSNGIQPTSQIAVEEEPEPPKKSNVKTTKKEQQLEMLKTNLIAMQDELKRVKTQQALSAEDDATNVIEAAAVPEPQNINEPAGWYNLSRPVIESKESTSNRPNEDDAISQALPADNPKSTEIGEIVESSPNPSQDVLINEVNPPELNNSSTEATNLVENNETPIDEGSK